MQDVAAHFQQFGTTTDVYLPFIPGRPGHKGFAFVSFTDAEAVQAAMSSGPHVINGSEVVVDMAMSRKPTAGTDGASQRPAGPRSEHESDRLFVTRVPATMTRDDVEKYFLQFGPIRDCYMPSIPGSGSHKGFAFISFTDSTSIKAATEKSQHEINGSTVVVDVAFSRAPGMQPAMQAGPGWLAALKMGLASLSSPSWILIEHDICFTQIIWVEKSGEMH
eukprot:symbB.v1.2.013755.t1/scaffold976.1/size149240/8